MIFLLSLYLFLRTIMNIPSSFLSFFAILALSTLTTFPRTDFLSGREVNTFLADIEHVIELHGNIGIENPTTISYERFRSAVATDGIYQHRKIVPLILCRGDGRGKHHARKVLKDGDHVHGLGIWEQMLFDVSDISTPELVPPACLKWHLQFRAWCRFRLLLDAIEPAISCHDPATGRRTHLDPHTQKRGVNAILSQQGILLEFADLVS